jgi:hypothetical protein
LVHGRGLLVLWPVDVYSSDDPEYLEELEQQRASLLKEKEAFKVRRM